MLQARQHFAAFVVRCLFLCLYKTTIEGAENLENIPGPFIIAANHPSQIDPVLLSFLPKTALERVIPIRYMMAQKYYKQPWYWIVSAPFGAYSLPRWSTSLEEHMGESVNILNQGQSIMMFPEGRFEKNSGKKVGKPGIGYLAIKTESRVIPLYISFESSRKSFRKEVRLVFSKNFKFNRGSQEEVDQLVKHIYSLKSCRKY